MFSQGVGSDNVPWRFTTVNQEFGLCETYPQVLVVPSACSDDDIRSVAGFRSKGRLPVSDMCKGCVCVCVCVVGVILGLGFESQPVISHSLGLPSMFTWTC